MAAFPTARRFLTADCILLVHERRMDKKLRLTGALRAYEAIVRDALAEIENGKKLERVGFSELIDGSSLTINELSRHVGTSNRYVSAREAHKLGLVAAVI